MYLHVKEVRKWRVQWSLFLDMNIPPRYIWSMFIYRRFMSFQRLEIFHISLQYPIGNTSCPHGLVEHLILQFLDSHSMKQIEKREKNDTSFPFIKSTLLRYKFHEIKYSYLKFYVNFGIWVCLYKHHHNQNFEHFHHF